MNALRARMTRVERRIERAIGPCSFQRYVADCERLVDRWLELSAKRETCCLSTEEAAELTRIEPEAYLHFTDRDL